MSREPCSHDWSRWRVADRRQCLICREWEFVSPFPPFGTQSLAGPVTVTLPAEDYRFITEYDPDRERSASRRELVEVLSEIAVILQENRR